MKTLAILLILVLLHTPEACGQSLRVATYNLNWANRRGDQVLDAIGNADPDLICFQETTVESERFLREKLSETYPYFHAAGHEGRYAAERFAFASKRELTQLRFVPPNHGLFGFYSARLTLANTTMHVVNVHLSPFQIRRGGGVIDAVTALSTTEEVHAREIAAVMEAIDPQQPTIVVGDFNSLSTFNAPMRLVEFGLTDAYASIHEDADTHPTWHWPARPLPFALRIDYIFHTRHFVGTEATVIRRDGSDHSMTVVELRLGEQSHSQESRPFEAYCRQMHPQPLLAVRDVASSRQWYEAVLGLRSGHGGDEYDQLMYGERMVLQLHHWDVHEHPHLGDPESPVGNGAVLWFQTDHFEAIVSQAQTHHAQILEGPRINPYANHREMWLRDLDGYIVVVAGPPGDV